MLNRRVYQLLFYAYALLAAPWFAGNLRAAFENREVFLLPGLIILLALIAETVALPWAFRRWHSAAGGKSGIPLQLGAAICISHAILTYFLGIYLLDAFGVMGVGTAGDGQAFWMAATFILLFFRESYLFFATGVALRSVKPVSKGQDIAVGILLLFFRCVAYTSYWDVMMAVGPVRGMHSAVWIVLGPALVLIFYIIYLPIRMTDLLGAYYTEGAVAGRRETRRLLVSGAVLALYPVFGPGLIALVTGR